MSATFEVEKFARDGQGRWFGFGARRFRDIEAARAYFGEFAAEQREVLGNGARIDLRERKGRRVLLRAGGRLHDATAIREVES